MLDGRAEDGAAMEAHRPAAARAVRRPLRGLLIGYERFRFDLDLSKPCLAHLPGL